MLDVCDTGLLTMRCSSWADLEPAVLNDAQRTLFESVARKIAALMHRAFLARGRDRRVLAWFRVTRAVGRCVGAIHRVRGAGVARMCLKLTLRVRC